jgi:hypothetical protein
MRKIVFREYEALLSTKPLIEGIIPTTETLKPSLYKVIAPNGHVLTKKEWSEVIFDNILCCGELPIPKSPYKINELTFEDINEENVI